LGSLNSSYASLSVLGSFNSQFIYYLKNLFFIFELEKETMISL